MKKYRKRIGVCAVALCLLLALCGCTAVPDFSAWENYGITDYPGKMEGLSVFDYLQSVAPPEAAANVTDFSDTVEGGSLCYSFDAVQAQALLKDAKIPDLDELNGLSFWQNGDGQFSSYALDYTRKGSSPGGYFVIAQYMEDGAFRMDINLSRRGSRSPKVLSFDSRDQSVALN